MLESKRIVNLSHILKPTIPTWNADQACTTTVLLDYADCTTATKFRVQGLHLDAGLGVGTHIDAPAHCFAGGRTVEMLSLHELVAPCFVIDVSKHAQPTSLIGVDVVHQFEEQYGVSFANSIVLFKTNWSHKWSHPAQYRNDLQFPALLGNTAQYLVKQKVLAIGIDTLGADRPENHFIVHEIVLKADRYLIENLTDLDQLPPVGATLMVMPLAIAGATEAPARVVGIISL